MSVLAHLRPLPRLRAHGGAALAAETVGAAESDELPGAARETKALFVSRHHQLAQRAHGARVSLVPQIQQITGQSLPLIKTLERGVSQLSRQTRFTALWHLTLLIEQYQMIAPPSTNQRACSVNDIR